MSQITEPPAPLRGNIEPDALAELARSLSTQGQLQPILVKASANGFTIIAGHRRYLAARSLGWPTIEAKILPANTPDEQILSLIENLHREPLTPVEEARVVYNLVIDRALDVDLAASLFSKTRAWIDARLALLEYPENLLDAIHAETISLSVARELCRVTDDGFRAFLLHNAVENGCTAKTARLWADDWQRSHASQGEPTTAVPGPPPPYEGQAVGIACAACDKLYPIQNLRPLYCCPGCVQEHFAMKAKARNPNKGD